MRRLTDEELLIKQLYEKDIKTGGVKALVALVLAVGIPFIYAILSLLTPLLADTSIFVPITILGISSVLHLYFYLTWRGLERRAEQYRLDRQKLWENTCK